MGLTAKITIDHATPKMRRVMCEWLPSRQHRGATYNESSGADSWQDLSGLNDVKAWVVFRTGATAPPIKDFMEFISELEKFDQKFIATFEYTSDIAFPPKLGFFLHSNPANTMHGSEFNREDVEVRLGKTVRQARKDAKIGEGTEEEFMKRYDDEWDEMKKELMGSWLGS